MYIKQIIIQGFKSYKEQTVIEPFSPKSNVVVGRNGSGKSNFFAAVRFVLGDEYSHIGREERQALLHEGSGSAVMSAYVEVIFDNSDDRFPTGKPELILRRTIGVKKDEYSLDRKNATKADVMNLLESAGFSRANPYYIVPQGRVTKLTNMDEAARLNLLKDVAGTQVYEARRAESLKIIADTDNKRAKIDDLLEYIQERLAQLEEEKEELRQYQEKDREHRSLQYTILVRSQQNYQTHLDRIDDQRTAGVDETDENQRVLDERQEEIDKLDEEISQAQRQIESLKIDKMQLSEERTELVRHKAKAELEYKSVADGQSAAQQTRRQREADLKSTRQKISEREKELKKLTPQYNDAKSQEDALKSQVQDASSTIDQLRNKQARSEQYRSKKERDDALNRLIESVNNQLAELKANAMENDEDSARIEEDIKRLEEETTHLRGRIDNRGTDAQSRQTALQKLRDERDRLTDSQRELWREAQKLEAETRKLEQDWRRAEETLQKLADRNTWQAIKAVRRLKERHNLEGVYGTLGELFQVDKNYRTAVEIVAGQSIFHWVVDNDDTASELINMLNKEKAGRISVMPLNRLRTKSANIPKAGDAVPMISKIQYDPMYENAFQHVFGRTIICPNLQVASQYARSHGVSAITPDGDRADKKGALTGGYHDIKVSRLVALRQEQQLREQYEEQLAKQNEIRRSIERLAQEVTRAGGEVQKAEQGERQQHENFGRLNQEVAQVSMELRKKRDDLQRMQTARANVQSHESNLIKRQAAYQAELSAPYQKGFSSAEEQQLVTTSANLQTLRKQFNDLYQKRSDLETRKSTIELELNENLRPTLDQLTAQGFDGGQQEGAGGSERQVEEKQRILDGFKKKLETVLANIESTNDELETAAGELNQMQEDRSKRQKDREELERRIEKQQREVVRNMEDRRHYAECLTGVNKEIRDLGVLPEEAFAKYRKLDLNKAMERLKKVKEALKKFSGVNKKAFEQYNNFTRQRETLTSRRKELEKSRRSIEELIEHLDQRKDEAIERTFKQVSKEFANVFGKLVPAGKGRLVIVRKSDRQAAEEGEESGDARGEGSIENYKGVGIKVSFNSKHDEQQKIQQLSGGQKSLCALALVFAIQQCDPAPFYLFDEIDANLDAQYRTAVAAMLKQLSEAGAENGGGQFICTTFRPEMVRVAEKCYGVGYSNKTSSIDVVDREQALEFVEGATQGRR